jgi:4-amino-4-deoxy-L-arabinose transferase-like glycosyltransferase
LRYFDRNTWFWIAISGLFFLPFLGGVPLFDWDEINFAELAREMVVTGDWLRLQVRCPLAQCPIGADRFAFSLHFWEVSGRP